MQQRLGAHQLQQDNFATRLAELLAACPNVTPQSLQFDALETSAQEDLSLFTRVVHDCLALSVSFALDDFGTGYSLRAYIKNLPTETLKIDQSFARNLFEIPTTWRFLTA